MSVSLVRFVSGNYLLKGNRIITFCSYIRIMSESYVLLTLGNYVIKSCKWDQKLRSSYVWKLRQDYVTKTTLELRQKVRLD